ncbi:MAG TPA: hypothetical protein VF157_05475 [Chloroflexota bacterium]
MRQQIQLVRQGDLRGLRSEIVDELAKENQPKIPMSPQGLDVYAQAMAAHWHSGEHALDGITAMMDDLARMVALARQHLRTD